MGNEIRMFVPTAEKQTYRDVQQTGGSIGVRKDNFLVSVVGIKEL